MSELKTTAQLQKIFVIDDELQIRRLLELALQADGYQVDTAAKGKEGLAKIPTERPELVILDLGLPDMDGVDVLKKLREWSTVPVIVLTVRSSEADIVACLDAGADDYLTKPFRTGELLARVRNAMRHSSRSQEAPLIAVRDLQVDLSSRIVKKAGTQIKLTATEYSLLELFVRNIGKVLTHKYLLEHIWGPSFSEESQYTRVYVGQLRKKIENDPANPRIIITESGIGYRLVADK